MKKVITTVSAMTLTLQAGSSQSNDTKVNEISVDDLSLVYAGEASFKGSGFVDLAVDKTVLLSYDADASGNVTLGDQLKYTIQVTNLSDIEASGITLLDFLESKIELNLGTVAVTQGVVVSGNDFVDNNDLVHVEFGDIAANWFALVNFDVTVIDLNVGPNVIVNSGEVYADDGSFFLSDDPTTPLFDPTMINAIGFLPDLIFQNDFEFIGSGGF